MFRTIFVFLLISASSLCSGQSSIKEEWRNFIKISLNSINKSTSLKIDKEGNCYVLGTTWMADSTKDILLVKFDPQGNEVWVRTYDNPAHGDDIPMSMCFDPEGNIWVCGMARIKSDNADFLIVKFTPDGIPIVDELYDGRDHLFDCAVAIASDKFGNIYAGGYETALDSGINMMLVKYRPNGSTAWRRTYATRQMDIANSLIVDDSCNVYLCGTSNNGPHTSDILFQKYDSTGKKKFQIIYDGVFSQNDIGQFIVADDSMNIYVSGFMNHSNNRADIPLLKFNRNGQTIQENIYNGRISDCEALSLHAYKHKVYVTGLCNDYNVAEITTVAIKYDKAGKEKFVIRNPLDVQYLDFLDVQGVPMIVGSKLTHPESTLIPFIAACDSSTLAWTFSDSTVYGLTHITDIETHDNDIYYLGDDTGDATGTIRVYKYTIIPVEVKIPEPVEIKKLPSKKRK